MFTRVVFGIIVLRFVRGWRRIWAIVEGEFDFDLGTELRKGFVDDGYGLGALLGVWEGGEIDNLVSA